MTINAYIFHKDSRYLSNICVFIYLWYYYFWNGLRVQENGEPHFQKNTYTFFIGWWSVSQHWAMHILLFPDKPSSFSM
jgi:hypothetical protein